MKTSESVVKIATALAKAEATINHAVKDAKNPHFKSTYATLESVIDASKEALLAQEIVVIQSPQGDELTTRLQHSSGEFIESTLRMILSKQDMQAMGSALTYARRYALAAMINIHQSDDDANAAVAKDQKPKESAPKPKDEKPNSDPDKGFAPKRPAPASKEVITKTLKAFANLYVSEKSILNFIGVSSSAVLSDHDIEQLKVLGQDIKSGRVTVEEIFGTRESKI